MRRLTFALVCIPLLAAPAPAQEKSKVTRDDLRAILEKARKAHDVPALGAAVVTSGGLSELAVVGVRKRGDATAAKETDLFHIGSDTKAMTATMIARLVQKKLLRYDLTLAQSFPHLKMPEDLGKVTLTQCLNHTGGLPENLAWERLPRKGAVTGRREEAVRVLLKAKRPAKPGEKFLYSNTGYVVAARMAERATEKSWEELLLSQVAKPLKMTIGHGAMGTRGKVDQPWQHEPDGEPVEPGPDADNPAVMGPAGNVHCSLADWAKFIADQLAGARGKDGLLAAASYKVLHTANEGDKYTPGGWLIIPGPAGDALGHDGSNGMNYATAILIPKQDVAVLVVCNQGGKKKGEKATHEAREAILKKALGK